jgi:hypothetical protein
VVVVEATAGTCTATHFEVLMSSIAAAVSPSVTRSFSTSLLVALSSEVTRVLLSPDEDDVSDDVDNPEDDSESVDLSETSDWGEGSAAATGEMTSASASESHSESVAALAGSGLADAFRLLRLCLRLSASFY